MDVDQDRWTLARRLRQYDAEIRINVVRVAAIGIFYMVHLVHYLAVTNGSAPLAFLGLDAGDSLAAPMHAAVTCVVLAWVMAAVGIHQLLRAGLFPWWLMYASTVGDLFFLTSVLALSSGPTGPLLSGYFVILIMSGLRYDLRLVRVTTCGALMGYATLLGCARWPIGLFKKYPLPAVPRYQELMMAAAIIIAGALVGQWIRHTRLLVDDLVGDSSPRRDA